MASDRAMVDHRNGVLATGETNKELWAGSDMRRASYMIGDACF